MNDMASTVRVRLLSFFFMACLAITGITAGYSISRHSDLIARSLEERARTLARTFSALFDRPLASGASAEVERVLEALGADESLLLSLVTDARGEVIAEAHGGGKDRFPKGEVSGLARRALARGGEETSSAGGAFLVAVPLRSAEGEVRGALALAVSREPSVALSADMVEGQLVLCLVLLAGGLGATALVSRFLLSPLTGAMGRIIRGVARTARRIYEAAGHLASSSLEIAQGATEQASSLQQTSSSLQQIASMTRQNAENARRANQVATDAFSSAERSLEAMRRLVKAMSLIKNSAGSMAKILKTIDAIAFQTNLLALNAAVEAARAGDAGRGFAVVAEEVRNLARQSAEAAKKTSGLIKESQENADNGVAASMEVEEVLVQIAGAVREVKQLAAGVSSASDEQAAGIEQTSSAAVKLDALTQMNAANSQQASSVSESLFAHAKELNALVHELGAAVAEQTVEDAADPEGLGSLVVQEKGRRGAERSRPRLAGGITPRSEEKRRGGSGRAPDSRDKDETDGDGRGDDTDFSWDGPLGDALNVAPEKVIPLTDEELTEFER